MRNLAGFLVVVVLGIAAISAIVTLYVRWQVFQMGRPFF
jgi:hypothetical protein